MRYNNPYYRKIKGSRKTLISCGHCMTNIAIYQKAGKGSLLRMYVNRIVKSSIDLSDKPGALFCPKCGEQLGTKVALKRKKTEAYIMVRGEFHSEWLR